MNLPNPPPGWGTDELTLHLDSARGNSFANFEFEKNNYEKLSQIDALFEMVVKNLNHTGFSALFVFQAHSAFRGAVSLLLGGQATEAYTCLRLSLENALYGFYFFKNPKSLQTWMRRHESEETKKKVRKEFQIRGGPSAMLNTLKSSNKNMGDAFEILYEHSIDFGAHPNQYGLQQRTTATKLEGENINIQMSYLVRGDSPSARIAVDCAVNVGIGVLSVFRLIYPDRFDASGAAQKMNEFRQKYLPK
jgi:hypothetical protein